MKKILFIVLLAIMCSCGTSTTEVTVKTDSIVCKHDTTMVVDTTKCDKNHDPKTCVKTCCKESAASTTSKSLAPSAGTQFIPK